MSLPHWWQCPSCGGDREVERVEITAYGDTTLQFIDGAPYECDRCGDASMPVMVRLAPCMTLISYGPPVPTPEDILRAAGRLQPELDIDLPSMGRAVGRRWIRIGRPAS